MADTVYLGNRVSTSTVGEDGLASPRSYERDFRPSDRSAGQIDDAPLGVRGAITRHSTERNRKNRDG